MYVHDVHVCTNNDKTRLTKPLVAPVVEWFPDAVFAMLFRRRFNSRNISSLLTHIITS